MANVIDIIVKSHKYIHLNPNRKPMRQVFNQIKS